MASNSPAALQPYHKWVIDNICQFSRINGTEILEIGGVPNQIGIASYLLDMGATTVTQINNRTDLQNHSDGNRKYFCMDARNMEFPESSFDVVFSASVLEHLLEIPTVLHEIHRVTKPGGYVCLHGGSFWNCRWGHHVWVNVDDEKYQFNGNNPLPDWSHLYFDRDEMTEYLLNDGIPAAHVEKIVYWVYDSPEINRLTYDNLVEEFNRCDFEIVSLTPKNWRYPDPELSEKLYAMFGNQISSYSIGEAVVVLKKR